MTLVSYDVETHPIRPGCLTPPLVVSSWAWDNNPSTQLTLKKESLARLRIELSIGSTIVTHNGYYDFGVACNEDPSLYDAVFQAYNDGRIRDTKVRQWLLDIAAGCLHMPRPDGTQGYSLAGLELHYLGLDRSEEKSDPDAWRMRYHELDGIPLDKWPAAAVAYAKADAEGTLRVFKAQELAAPPGGIAAEVEVTRAFWGLHLMSCRGMRTDAERVAKLKALLLERRASSLDTLKAAGFLRGAVLSAEERREGREPDYWETVKPSRFWPTGQRPMKWSKDTKAIARRVESAYRLKGRAPPATETGGVSTDRDTLEHSDDDSLKALAFASITEKLLTAFIPALERGTTVPLLPSYGIAETGRTTCSAGKSDGGLPLGANIQQLPRGSPKDKSDPRNFVRECFVAPDGRVYVSADLDTAELRGLAHVCRVLFGFSKLGDALDAGRDPHLDFGAQLLGISYEEAAERHANGDEEVEDARQFAKVANFGLPGGLGVTSLIEYARANYGVELTEREAKRLKDRWLRAYPEMVRYFDYVSRMVGEGTTKLTLIGNGLVRGNVSYTAACNSYFQGIVAAGATEACFRVAWECYVNKGTGLYGARPCAFVHDQIIVDAEPERIHAVGERLVEVMCESVGAYIYLVKVTASPVAMPRWIKKAKTVRDSTGRLLLYSATPAPGPLQAAG